LPKMCKFFPKTNCANSKIDVKLEFICYNYKSTYAKFYLTSYKENPAKAAFCINVFEYLRPHFVAKYIFVPNWSQKVAFTGFIKMIYNETRIELTLVRTNLG